MFVRKKKNKSGVISIQVIDKSTGSYRVLKTIGSSSDPEVIEQLYSKGKKWIEEYCGQLSLEFSKSQYSKEVAKSIKSIKAVGIELLITKLYDDIGFNQVDSDILRYLVITRIANPVSKLKSVEYLKDYHNIHLGKDQIYRYLDKLYIDHKEQIRQISYQYTLKELEKTKPNTK